MRGRVRRCGWSVAAMLVAVALGGGGARADEPPIPPVAPTPAAKPTPALTPEHAADIVLVAIKAKDDADLKALAAKDEPDPWIVAEFLLLGGHRGEALSFAQLVTDGSGESLVEYIASYPRTPGAERTGPDTVSAVHRLDVRARELWASDAGREAISADLETAQAAARLGWLAMATRACLRTVEGRGSRWDPPRAVEVARLHLSVAERRRSSSLVRQARSTLGQKLREAGMEDEALEVLQRSLEESRAAEDRRVEAATLGEIAIVQDRRSEFEASLGTLGQAIKIEDALGERGRAAILRTNYALALSRLGRNEEAVVASDAAIPVLEAEGDRLALGSAYLHRGMGFTMLSRIREAEQDYRAAEAISGQIGERRLQARALGNLADLANLTGRQRDAIEHAERSLSLAREVEDASAEGVALYQLGCAYELLDDGGRADAFLIAAEGAYARAGDRRGVASCRERRADRLLVLDRTDEAFALLEQVIADYESMGYLEGQVTTLVRLARIHLVQGDHVRAKQAEKRALALDRRLGAPLEEAVALNAFALMHFEVGDREEAARLSDQAIRLAEDLGNPRVLETAAETRGRMHVDKGEWPEALRCAHLAADALLSDLATLTDDVAVGRLGGERTRWMVEGGAGAAWQMGDHAECAWFLELERGVGLLSALGNRDRLRAAVIPGAMRDAEAAARREEAAAASAYRQALRGTDLTLLREQRDRMHAAQGASRRSCAESSGKPGAGRPSSSLVPRRSRRSDPSSRTERAWCSTTPSRTMSGTSPSTGRRRRPGLTPHPGRSTTPSPTSPIPTRR